MSADNDLRDVTLQALLRRHSNETPSADVDAAIRDAAHEAVERKPVRRSAAWRVWVPLAAAASIAAVLIGEAPRAPIVNDERAVVADVPEKRAADRAPSVAAAAESTGISQPPPAQPSKQRPRAQPNDPPPGTQSRDAEPRFERFAPTEQPPAVASAKPNAAERDQLSISRGRGESAKTDAPARTDARSKIASAPPEAGASPAAPAPGVMSEAAPARTVTRQETPIPATPADWIARIRTLRNAGNDAEAVRELARFRDAYADADARLPDDLRAWAAARR